MDWENHAAIIVSSFYRLKTWLSAYIVINYKVVQCEVSSVLKIKKIQAMKLFCEEYIKTKSECMKDCLI